MRSRLEDLMATAERQWAAGSYEAAIDTYRTALSEPGAAEAGAAEKLAAAEAVRDARRGIVRPAPPEVAGVPETPPVSAEPTAVPVREPKPVPAPEPTRAPSFHPAEDDPDPARPPKLPDPLLAARIAVAALIFVLVCGFVFLLK